MAETCSSQSTYDREGLLCVETYLKLFDIRSEDRHKTSGDRGVYLFLEIIQCLFT